MTNKYTERINKLRTLMTENGLEAFYICQVNNVSYYTGKHGNDCSLYITQDEAWIITDFRYEEMAQSLSWLQFYETALGRSLLDFLKSRKEKILGIERNGLSLDMYFRFKEELTAELKPVIGLTEKLRQIKDPEELENIARAEAIGDAAFTHILKYLKPGVTEKEVAAEIEYAMRQNGADGLSFTTIAVSGKNSSSPHGVPTDKKLENGDFVTMDYGCLYNLYCSDMTRTVAIGNATDEMKKVYDIVYKAQTTACERIKAGITGKEGDSIARDIIAEAGYGDRFGHSLGHSLGLFIHESPNYSQRCEDTIEENMVLSIEPGIYLPGKFGVRIEDIAIVKKDGIVNLTHSPKELIII